MRKILKVSYFALVLFFLYCPIFIMMMFSFNKGSTITVFRGWSFRWYLAMGQYTDFTSSIIVSLFVGAISTIISLLIGIPACAGLLRMNKRKQTKWISITNMPIINADIITAVSLLVCFTMMGLNLGIVTLIAAHVSFNVPFVILTVLPFMRKINKEYYNASADLGAGPIETFFKIIIPNLYPPIISASVLAFSMSFDDFIISYFTSGSVTNVSTFIYSAQRIQPYINAFGTLMVCVVTIFVIFYNIIVLTRKKILLDKENIISGVYGSKKEKKTYRKLVNLYNKLNYEFVTRRSFNIFKYIRFKYYYYVYKYYSSKNVETKIFKLIAKREKILEDIKWEKRTYLRFERYSATLENIENNPVGETDKIKYKRQNNVANKLRNKINKLSSDIEWIEKRNSSVLERIDSIKDELQLLDTNIENNEIKKSVANKLTKKYKKELAYLQEGPNIYKLKINIDKQHSIVAKDRLSIEKAYWKLRSSKNALTIKKNISYRFNNKLRKLDETKDFELYQKIINKRNENIEAIKENTRYKILFLENKIEYFNNKIIKKRNKLLGIKETPTITKDNNILFANGRGFRYKNTLIGLLLTAILISSTSVFAFLYVRQGNYDLVFANWGSYISPQLIKDFEDKYNVRIGYQEYDSNETLYGKQQYYNYDLMVPSDYMVQKLASQDRIQKLDWSRITSAKYSNEVEPADDNPENPSKFVDPDPEKLAPGQDIFDNRIYKLHSQAQVPIFLNGTSVPENISDYCLPYLWGCLEIVFNVQNRSVRNFMNSHGITYNDNNKDNSNQIDPSTLGWESLWDAADLGLNVDLNFDSKNLYMYSLEKNYGTPIPKDESANNIFADDMIKTAYNDLYTLVVNHKKNVKLMDDQLIDAAVGNQFDIAVMYNGDVAYSYSDGDHDFAVGIPGKKALIDTSVTQNTNTWTDNIVIGKNNKNIDLTYKLINFLYSEESQEINTDELSITSPLSNFNDSYVNSMEDPRQKNIYQFYHSLDSDHMQAFIYDEENDQKLANSYADLISLFGL